MGNKDDFAHIKQGGIGEGGPIIQKLIGVIVRIYCVENDKLEVNKHKIDCQKLKILKKNKKS